MASQTAEDLGRMKTFKKFLEQDERQIDAKIIEGAPEWSPEHAEGNYRVGEITFSAKDGLGSVPFNQSVYYHGFVVEIKPSVFADIVLPDDTRLETAKAIGVLVLKGYALGIPFISVDTKAAEEGTGPVRVTGHEGRARMMVVKMSNGDEPVPIHVLLGGGTRARHLTPELIAAIKGRIQVEGSKRIVMSPFEKMYVNGVQV